MDKKLGANLDRTGACQSGVTDNIKNAKSSQILEIPESYHVHEAHSECRPVMIRNQGECGSCWAWATTAAMSQRLCIKGEQIEKTLELSKQELISCSKEQFQGRANAGCSGGYMDLALKHMKENGIHAENCLLYKSSDQSECSDFTDQLLKCREDGDAEGPDLVKGDTARYYISDCFYHSSDDLEAIQYDILMNGPVVAALTLHNDFADYDGGIYAYDGTSANIGGHAAVIVGWGQDEEDTPFWIVQNSWGDDWGEFGYFRILRGINEVDIEQFVVSLVLSDDIMSDKFESEYPYTDTSSAHQINIIKTIFICLFVYIQ
eukprot:GHVL01035720.1.p1 GENE.GHVL01035720.1~~GHVL01035720.1.p1  ORF type:complete len:319 (+),score=72.38 GHVL01035720.1:726-1682(+)